MAPLTYKFHRFPLQLSVLLDLSRVLESNNEIRKHTSCVDMQVSFE